MAVPTKRTCMTPIEDGNASSTSYNNESSSSGDEDAPKIREPLAPRPSKKRSREAMFYSLIDSIKIPELDSPIGISSFKLSLKPRTKLPVERIRATFLSSSMDEEVHH